MELTIEDLLRLIGQVGFPIVIATYLLIRNNGKMDKLKEAILELKEVITLLREDLNK
ncbi:MAG: YvrJ family protein [Caldisericia bacterium]|nr:YvrJ family protein [Caldisericia bacterium]